MLNTCRRSRPAPRRTCLGAIWRFAFSFTGFAVALPASAHLPHEWVTGYANDGMGNHWVAISPDLVNFGATTLVLVSTDAGKHWEMLPPPLATTEGFALSYADNRLVLALRNGELREWDGQSWHVLESPTPSLADLALSDRGLALATNSGLWLEQGGEWVLAGPATQAVTWWRGEMVSLRDDQTLWTGFGDTLAQIPNAPADLRTIAADGERLYAASQTEISVFQNRQWLPCVNIVPTIPGLENGEVVDEMSAERGLLAVHTGQEAFVSANACGSWTALAPWGPVTYGGTGQVPNFSAVYAGLSGEDGWLVAGYEGVSWTETLHGSWQRARLIDSYAVRTVDSMGTGLRTGSYGSGPASSEDGGNTWVFSHAGLEFDGMFIRSQAGDGEGMWVALGDLAAYVSTDEDTTWQLANLPFGRVATVSHAGGKFWVTQHPVQGSGVATSEEGVAWLQADSTAGRLTSVHDLFFQGQWVVAGITTEPTALLQCRDACSTWKEWVADDDAWYGVATWPPKSGDRLIRASNYSISYSDDAGVSWTASEGLSAPVRVMAFDPAGIGWAIDVGGTSFTSVNGGESWAAGTSLPSPTDITFIEVAGEDTVAVVSTVDGVYWSDNLAVAWQRLPSQEHLRPDMPVLTCVALGGGGCVETQVDGANVWQLGDGDEVRFTTRAETIVVGGENGNFVLRVDGVELATVEVGQQFSLGSFTGKDVVLVARGEESHLSYIELGLSGEPIPMPLENDNATAPGRDTTACGGEGCAANPGIFGLLLAATVKRRRIVARTL